MGILTCSSRERSIACVLLPGVQAAFSREATAGFRSGRRFHAAHLRLLRVVRHLGQVMGALRGRHDACTATRAMLAFQGRMLKRAAEICGGYSVLCAQLSVSESRLQQWIDGRAALPDDAFLKAADIVLEDDIARAAQDRRTNPRTRPPAKTEQIPAGHA